MKSRNRDSWRNYQADLQRIGLLRRTLRRLPFRGTVLAIVALLVIGSLISFFRGGAALQKITTATAATPAPGLTSKRDLGQILDDKAFANLTRKTVGLPVNGRLLQVETTLDVDLQSFLLNKIDRTNSRHVGIVVMDGTTGRVLAMSGFDKLDPSDNPCLRSHYPAASIFKIVTAASALDQCGYTADSPMHFSGGKHTLYKRQLANKIDRYTTTVPFRDAFADSINPVFGKIGGIYLQKPLLEKSADAFGFNAPLDFELPLPPSHFAIGDQPYNWAEVASGFNRETTISPLHGAMIASAVLNAGKMVTPSIVERIVDSEGKLVYAWQPGVQQQAMSARAARELSLMMEETISSGTARKAFRRFRNDKVLARLEIGGKTGSIDSASHDLRYDWFVGFAREPVGRKQIVIAAVVAHEKYIGTRASEYARMAMMYYFGNFPGKVVASPAAGSSASSRRS